MGREGGSAVVSGQLTGGASGQPAHVRARASENASA
jgi:hypothetical protein